MTWSFVIQGEMHPTADIREECADFAAHLKERYGEEIEISVFTGPEGWSGGSDQDPTQPVHVPSNEHVDIAEQGSVVDQGDPAEQSRENEDADQG